MAAGRGRQGRGGRTGTVLVSAGIVGILTVTFVAGVWTGRHWPLLSGSVNAAAPADASPGRRGVGERPRQAEPLPALTFYQELTAPLTAPPPLPKPAKAPRPPEPKREADKVDHPAPSAASPEPAAHFTIQVGAYNVRTPAETLRTTLTAAGHDARVVEAATPGGVRYRVQVGAFATREAARDAAARLTTDRSLPAFVTTR